MNRYAKPRSLEEALALMAEAPWRLVAGGTDFYPALGSVPLREDILDLNHLGELRGITETADYLVIGARTTWSEVIRHDLPPAFDALKQAAREVGSVQIQNAGTVAGNLCNASPAADGVPPLLVLDAEVELASAKGKRRLPLGDFLLGNRRTARRPDEIMTAIRVPRTSAAGISGFVKLGARRYLVISIAMAAARLFVKDGRVARAAVVVGSCSAVALRLAVLETALVGRPADASLGDGLDASLFDALSPIDDVRGGAAYRREAARELVRRSLAMALGRHAGARAAA